MSRMEGEVKLNEYLCLEKLPREIETKEEMCGRMEHILNQEHVSHGDLETLQAQVHVSV